MKNVKRTLKRIGFLGVIIFVLVTAYQLMADPKQQSFQIMMGVLYHAFFLVLIYQRIGSIRVIRQGKKHLVERMYADFKLGSGVVWSVFALYSGFILILNFNEIRNVFFSSLWLQLLILTFQSIPFMILSYQLHSGVAEKKMKFTFNALYITLSVLFGYTSAQIGRYVLQIPAQQDLFIAAYGVLIMPIIFIAYFDQVYD